MIVYKPLGSDGAELAQPVEGSGYEVLETQGPADWRPPSLALHREDGDQVLRPSDAPWLTSASLILKDRAKAALATTVRGQAEFLPLECASEPLWLLNPLHLVDGLDEERCVMTRNASSGRPLLIQLYAFRPAAIEGLTVFKVTSFRVGPTYVNERFVAAWRDAGLWGLEFVELWRD